MELVLKANCTKDSVSTNTRGLAGCSADCGCDGDHYVYPCELME